MHFYKLMTERFLSIADILCVHDLLGGNEGQKDEILARFVRSGLTIGNEIPLLSDEFDTNTEFVAALVGQFEFE